MYEQNFKKLEEVKLNKSKEIVHLLNVFGGKVSLTEILTLDVPLLRSMENVLENISVDKPANAPNKQSNKKGG